LSDFQVKEFKFNKGSIQFQNKAQKPATMERILMCLISRMGGKQLGIMKMNSKEDPLLK
jgi:hypothetical protein